MGPSPLNWTVEILQVTIDDGDAAAHKVKEPKQQLTPAGCDFLSFGKCDHSYELF
jgi:hypothetical protein